MNPSIEAIKEKIRLLGLVRNPASQTLNVSDSTILSPGYLTLQQVTNQPNQLSPESNDVSATATNGTTIPQTYQHGAASILQPAAPSMLSAMHQNVSLTSSDILSVPAPPALNLNVPSHHPSWHAGHSVYGTAYPPPPPPANALLDSTGRLPTSAQPAAFDELRISVGVLASVLSMVSNNRRDNMVAFVPYEPIGKDAITCFLTSTAYSSLDSNDSLLEERMRQLDSELACLESSSIIKSDSVFDRDTAETIDKRDVVRQERPFIGRMHAFDNYSGRRHDIDNIRDNGSQDNYNYYSEDSGEHLKTRFDSEDNIRNRRDDFVSVRRNNNINDNIDQLDGSQINSPVGHINRYLPPSSFKPSLQSIRPEPYPSGDRLSQSTSHFSRTAPPPAARDAEYAGIGTRQDLFENYRRHKSNKYHTTIVAAFQAKAESAAALPPEKLCYICQQPGHFAKNCKFGIS